MWCCIGYARVFITSVCRPDLQQYFTALCSQFSLLFILFLSTPHLLLTVSLAAGYMGWVLNLLCTSETKRKGDGVLYVCFFRIPPVQCVWGIQQGRYQNKTHKWHWLFIFKESKATSKVTLVQTGQEPGRLPRTIPPFPRVTLILTSVFLQNYQPHVCFPHLCCCQSFSQSQPTPCFNPSQSNK